MIETTGNDLVVIASDPKEMVESQHALIAQVRQKEAEVQAEIEQAVIAVDAAMRASVDAKPLQAILRRQVAWFVDTAAI